MSTLTLSHVFSNGVASAATQANTNFSELVTYLNGSVLHRDGGTVPTADLSMGGFQVENMGAGTAAADAVTLGSLQSYRDVGVWTGPSQSINTSTAKTWDTEVSDPLGMADLGVDNTLFTIPSNGYYMVVTEWYLVNTSYSSALIPYLNGEDVTSFHFSDFADSSSGSNHYWHQRFSFIWAVAGDEIVCKGGISTAYGPISPRLLIQKVAD